MQILLLFDPEFNPSKLVKQLQISYVNWALNEPSD